MSKDICEYCEIRENGSKYCIGNKSVIVCCGYPSLKKEECLVYQLKTENKKLQGKNAQLQCENEKLKEQIEYLKTANLKETVELIRKNGLEDHIVFKLLDLESDEKDKYKEALEEIRQVVEFAIEETLTVSQKNGTSKILEIINEVFK